MSRLKFWKKRVVTIAARRETWEIFERLVQQLEIAGIPFWSGSASWEGVLRIDFRAEDRSIVDKIIRVEISQNNFLRYLVKNGQKLRRFRPFSGRFDIALVHHLRDGAVFVTKIELGEWGPRKSYAGTKVGPDIPNPRFMYASSVERALSYRPHPLPDPETYDFPIDIVYTWVNDADPLWAAEREKWAAQLGITQGTTRRANHKERFRNRDELRYSLRSIEMFAPWVNRIHIVTADQTPEWLDTSHPKINLVSHSDIFDADHLPTFNSSAIECRLHRIPGLAEHFIYFNDDVFLGMPCSRSMFFYSNGISRFFMSAATAIPELHDGEVEEYLKADFNAIRLFRDHLQFSPTHLMDHTPHPARRSVLMEMEELFPDEFENCARSKFRSGKDLRPIAFMYPHYAFRKGLAVPGSTSYRYLALWKPKIGRQLKQTLRTRIHSTFCINDVGIPAEREEAVNRKVSLFMEAYFPLKSSFEK